MIAGAKTLRVDGTGPDRRLHDDVALGEVRLLAHFAKRRVDDGKSLVVKITKVVLVRAVLDHVVGVHQTRTGVSPGQELVVHPGVSPRRAHHHQIVGLPVDSFVVPDLESGLDTEGGEFAQYQRSIEVLVRLERTARSR